MNGVPQPSPTARLLRALGWSLAVLALCAGGIVLAQWLRGLPAGNDFLARFPGHGSRPAETPSGFPAWLRWQHFLNAFFLVLVIRSGWLVRTTERPTGFWSPRRRGNGGQKKISLLLWAHLAADLLWLANGLLFLVLLGVSGHWMRIVPTSWDVIPNAFSAAFQYASLDWPAEQSWEQYNALQQLSYFLVVFVLAPLALLSGARLSPLWPQQSGRWFPVQLARGVHFPTMLAFLIFIVVHLTLVLASGARRNLSHIALGRDEALWLGVVFLGGALLLFALGAWAVRPLVIRPLAALTGRVTKH